MPGETFDKKLLDALRPAPKLQVHLLRHFLRPGQLYLQRLREESGKALEDLELMLLLKGSKFDRKFADDPEELWQRLVQRVNEQRKQYYWNVNRAELLVKFRKRDFPDGVGSDSIMQIADLSKAQRSSLQRKDRGHDQVWTVTDAVVKPPTWQVNLLIDREASGLIVRTIFPGEMAPPLPDRGWQNRQQYLQSQEFWSEWCFLS